MAVQVQARRGTTTQHSTFTGAVGELTVDTDKDTVVVHDGATAGGFPLKRDNVTATNRLLGRSTAGAGAIEEITVGSGLTLSAGTLTASGSGLSDGDKGDVTVSSGGTVWSIDSGAVTYSKIQNVTATDRLLGRSTAGAGVIEEVVCTSAGRALLDDADNTAQRTTLGLGSLATLSTISNTEVASNAAIAFSKLASLTSANILVGSATNVATSTAMSGDVTISNTGVTTVVSGSTSTAGKLQLSDSVTSTSTSLAATANAAKTAYDIGAKRAIAIENPTATEKIIMFFTTTAMTLTQIRSVIIGGTSVDFRIIYGTDVSAAGTNTTTNAITCNSTTTGVSTTSFSSATVPANNFVWLTTSAVSGTVTQLSVSLVF